MPFIQHKIGERTRFLNFGGPNTGKTSALKSLANVLHAGLVTGKGVAVVSGPDEKGVDSLPQGEEFETFSYITERNPDTVRVIKEVEDVCFSLIEKPYACFVFEGLHKLYPYYLDIATGGALFQGEDFEPRLYTRAHLAFSRFIGRVYSSNIPLVIYTTWDDYEADRPARPGENQNTIPRFLYPRLPGQAAKNVLGECGGVFYSNIQKKCSHKGCKESVDETGEVFARDHFVWQCQPGGLVKGVGFKGPNGRGIPQFIHQDYMMLLKLYTKAIEP